MRAKFLTFSFLILAVLFAGATAWAMPAAADGAKAGNLSFRLPAFTADGLPDIDWGASLGLAKQASAESSSSLFSRLSVRLYGGFNYLSARDVNTGAEGYFSLLRLYQAEGATVTGGYNPLHSGYDFGGDLVFQITRNIGVGVGIGYLQSSRDSAADLADIGGTITITESAAIKAMPIRLGVFLSLPVARRLSLTADAGAVYYAGLKFDSSNMLDFNDGTTIDFTFHAERSNLSDNLGFQGDLGLEYRLSRTLGFFVEAAGRYARFKTFDQATETVTPSDGTPTSINGKLFIMDQTLTIGHFQMFLVSPTPPVPDLDVTFREPKIDLSGFSLQTGIRIRF